MRLSFHAGLVMTLLSLTATAWGGAAAPAASVPAELLQRRDMLSFGTSATADVTRDVLSLTFSTTNDGPDALSVQRELKVALDQALDQARKVGIGELCARHAPGIGALLMHADRAVHAVVEN